MCRKGAFQRLQDFAFIGLVAVQFQAEVAESHPVQPTFHHLKGGHFFTDEQDIFASSEQFGDDIGNRLGLAGARRSFHYQTLAYLDVLNDCDLRRVCVHDVIERLARLLVYLIGLKAATSASPAPGCLAKNPSE